MFYKFEKIVNKINKKSNIKQRIEIIKNNEQEFTINYRSLELKFYHENNYIKVCNQSKQKLFNIELITSLPKIKLCKVENN